MIREVQRSETPRDPPTVAGKYNLGASLYKIELLA
ncbi:Uncharacterised protein [Escherichia coli]|uniref:Uncharacterized protein n=1 Tax=Escherichia coli TaxID=562 RepID=A0A377JXY9_ECOLX|nr:Uncharacterised protein [Escherichia coli]